MLLAHIKFVTRMRFPNSVNCEFQGRLRNVVIKRFARLQKVFKKTIASAGINSLEQFDKKALWII